jgi:3-oxoacyl-[acyl-carrier protein] reductase
VEGGAVRSPRSRPTTHEANVVSPGLIVDIEFFGDSMTPEHAGHITGKVLAVNGGAHPGR